ncbi:MAG TPA: hypothetical protein DCZ10_15755 [Pelotomaculum sp.]|nr:hypothetical protein [Pelotomaculum sp.]
MKTQLIPFSGQQVQVNEAEVNGKIQRVITFREISSALGLDIRVIRRIVAKDKDLFEPLKGVTKMSTPGGEQYTSVLTRDGVVALLVKLSAGHVAQAKRDIIIGFQRWAIETLGEVMDGTYKDAYMLRLQLEIDRLRLEGDIQVKAGIIRVVEKYGDRLSGSELIPLVSGILGKDIPVERTYSATEIAEILSHETGRKVSAIKIGRLAKELGLRVDDGENEYTLITVTKAAHTDKVVQQVKYKKAGVDLIRQALVN